MTRRYGERMIVWFTEDGTPLEHGIIFENIEVTDDELILKIPEMERRHGKFDDPTAIIGLLQTAVHQKSFGRMEDRRHYFETKEMRFKLKDLERLLKKEDS